MHAPAPTSAPTYEGRPLVRPDDEIVDQGLGFDVVTLMSRRHVLRALGFGAVGVGLAACSTGTSASTASSSSTSAGTSTGASTATATVEIPDETAGPYPGDGTNGPDALSESGIVRSDIRSSFGEASGTADGVPMTLELTITDLANGGVPFAGVAVYVWHCDSGGNYSMYSEGITDQNYLRGVQVADDAGKVSYTSIFPACYAGRWPHIHFEVYPSEADITDATNAIATSQVALPQDVCDAVYATTGYEQSVTNLSQITLATDGIFGDDGGVTQLATVTGDVTAGYAVSLTAAVDTGTTPAAESGGGFGGRGTPPSGMGTPPSGMGTPPSDFGPPSGMGTPPSGMGTPPSGAAPTSATAASVGTSA